MNSHWWSFQQLHYFHKKYFNFQLYLLSYSNIFALHVFKLPFVIFSTDSENIYTFTENKNPLVNDFKTNIKSRDIRSRRLVQFCYQKSFAIFISMKLVSIYSEYWKAYRQKSIIISLVEHTHLFRHIAPYLELLVHLILYFYDISRVTNC